ncbi:large conductance mechanosensitive channel protein MscL [Hamadaea sp. NPDC051192]|uniref:large conductance mechanosensitive channel protein MscL n=1 Tax=Hamadaea sp. NPDC051192 TaxID=3154940 RepID=UPI00341E9D40
MNRVFKGFREFIARGNVVDLAVGIVIGAAFGAMITQFTKSFLEPLISVITGGHGTGGTFKIRGVTFDYGAFIGAVITFVLTAAAVYYFVVVPMNAWAKRRGKLAEEEMSDEVRLLTQIRDKLGK